MKKNIFAVCDLEADYAYNFMDYLNRKKNIPFEIQVFTSAETLLSFAGDRHIELLLISDKAMCPKIRELDIGKIVILSEGVHPPELDLYPSVYKYQASSDVIREVMACYGEEKSILPAKIPSRGLIKFFTKDCTIAVKAAPMITPTAMSITLPREINSLNSLIMLYSYI